MSARDSLFQFLHCSNCGEVQDRLDADDTASDCCSCDLVPASELPRLMLEMRRELIEWELRHGA